MGKLSRTKGVAWERYVAKLLTTVLRSIYKRVLVETREGNSGDVVGPAFLIQCKIGKQPNLFAALQEAVEAAEGDPRIPIAIVRRHGKTTRKPDDVVVLRLNDFLTIAEEYCGGA